VLGKRSFVERTNQENQALISKIIQASKQQDAEAPQDLDEDDEE
jgi:hypothetical protein